jgi:hypothetical protein
MTWTSFSDGLHLTQQNDIRSLYSPVSFRALLNTLFQHLGSFRISVSKKYFSVGQGKRGEDDIKMVMNFLGNERRGVPC